MFSGSRSLWWMLKRNFAADSLLESAFISLRCSYQHAPWTNFVFFRIDKMLCGTREMVSAMTQMALATRQMTLATTQMTLRMTEMVSGMREMALGTTQMTLGMREMAWGIE